MPVPTERLGGLNELIQVVPKQAWPGGCASHMPAVPIDLKCQHRHPRQGTWVSMSLFAGPESKMTYGGEGTTGAETLNPTLGAGRMEAVHQRGKGCSGASAVLPAGRPETRLGANPSRAATSAAPARGSQPAGEELEWGCGRARKTEENQVCGAEPRVASAQGRKS